MNLDNLLRNNRLDMCIASEFRGILSWSVTIAQYPCRGESAIVYREQFYTYPEMRKAISEFLMEFDKS